MMKSIFTDDVYHTRVRLSLPNPNQVLTSLKYKLCNIKAMPPNIKEKNWQKLMKKKYKHGLGLLYLVYHTLSRYSIIIW